MVVVADMLGMHWNLRGLVRSRGNVTRISLMTPDVHCYYLFLPEKSIRK